MRIILATAATALLLAGCDQSTQAPAQQQAGPPKIRVQGEEQKQLAAATEMDRAIGLKRAIYDSGATCKRVIATGYVTDYKSLQLWQANCDDGKNWAIFVAANGAVQVRPCGDLKDLKLPECKTLPPASAAAAKKPA